MKKISLHFKHAEFDDSRLNSAITEILTTNQLCAIASVDDGKSYIHTAFFCFDESLHLFFLSSVEAQHSKNFSRNATTAVSIYNSTQQWDADKKGIQLFGVCELLAGVEAKKGISLYLERFASLKEWVKTPDDFLQGAIDSSLYRINVHSIKLFNEAEFGEENFVSLHLS